MEDLGFCEGMLAKLNSRISRVDREGIVRNQVEVFCKQMEEVVHEFRDWDFENYKKNFDHRLSYLESVTKNIVTQAEYRSDTLKFEDKLLKKSAQGIDFVTQEIDQLKEATENRIGELKNVVHENEMKTVCKIQDCENLLKQRVSEPYLANVMKTRDDTILKRINQASDRTMSRADGVYKDLLGTPILPHLP